MVIAETLLIPTRAIRLTLQLVAFETMILSGMISIGARPLDPDVLTISCFSAPDLGIGVTTTQTLLYSRAKGL